MSFKDFSNLIRLPLGIMASISGLASAFVVILIEHENYTLATIFSNYFGQILVGLPIPFLIVCGAMAINDYYDYEADVKNNRKDRPLTSGKFTKSFALNLSIGMMLLGGLLSLILYYFWNDTVQVYIFPAVILFIAIAVSYSTWLKKYGFLGNVAVSLSYPAAMMLAMGVVGVTKTEAIITITSFVAMIFFSALGREVLKGVMDTEGDKIQGVKTIAVRYGPKKAAYLCTIFFVLAIPFSPIPLILTFLKRSLLSSFVYALFIFFTLFLLLKSGFNLLKDPSKETGIKGRKQTKLAFWFLVLGFFIASILLSVKI
jgi:geranylgeranylglycerol-phosphate geranylgeranyltransferase